MKSLIEMIIEDAAMENDFFYSPKEEDMGEIISSKKESKLVEEIRWFMENCVNEIEKRDEEVEYFQVYKNDLDRFISRHISNDISKKVFDKCVNKASRIVKEELWLDRVQSCLVNRFARFLKEM
jgi:sugar-specific transcriptional regulator TrmB